MTKTYSTSTATKVGFGLIGVSLIAIFGLLMLPSLQVSQPANDDVQMSSTDQMSPTTTPEVVSAKVEPEPADIADITVSDKADEVIIAEEAIEADDKANEAEVTEEIAEEVTEAIMAEDSVVLEADVENTAAKELSDQQPVIQAIEEEKPLTYPDRAPIIPSFDQWRVDAEGSAVVSGQAEPGAKVRVLVDNETVAQTTSDDTGLFATLFNLPPNELPSMMVLEAELADGQVLRSRGSVALAPTVSPALAQKQNVAEENVKGEMQSNEPAALLITEKGVTLLQSGKKELTAAPNAQPSDDIQVVVTITSHDGEGPLFISGTGEPDRIIRLYLNGTYLTQSTVAQNGDWKIEIALDAPGTYLIRIDQLDKKGKVGSRFETAFEKETGADFDLKAEAEQKEVEITVKSGYSLWRIARETYGNGVLYVQLYEANKNQIKDPDLIYPGQVLNLP